MHIPRLGVLLALLLCASCRGLSSDSDSLRAWRERRSSSVAGDAAPAADTKQQCDSSKQALDWERARQEYFYLDKVMATDLGGNCDQRMQAEGRNNGNHGASVR